MAISSTPTGGPGPVPGLLLRSPGPGQEQILILEQGARISLRTPLSEMQFANVEDGLNVVFPDGGTVVLENLQSIDPPPLLDLPDGKTISLAEIGKEIEIPAAGPESVGGGIGQYEGLGASPESGDTGTLGGLDNISLEERSPAADTGYRTDLLLSESAPSPESPVPPVIIEQTPEQIFVFEQNTPVSIRPIQQVDISAVEGGVVLGFSQSSLDLLNSGDPALVAAGQLPTSYGETIVYSFENGSADTLVGHAGGELVLRVSLDLEVLNGEREGQQGEIELFRGLDATANGAINYLPTLRIDVQDGDGALFQLTAVEVAVVDSGVHAVERDTGLEVREARPGQPAEVVSTTEIEVSDSLDTFVELTFTESTVSRLNSLGLTSSETPIRFAIDPATVGTTTTVLEGTANGDVVFRLSITPGEASPGGGSRYYEYSATVPGPIDAIDGQDIQLTELSFVLRDQDGDSREIRLDPLTIDVFDPPPQPADTYVFEHDTPVATSAIESVDIASIGGGEILGFSQATLDLLNGGDPELVTVGQLPTSHGEPIVYSFGDNNPAVIVGDAGGEQVLRISLDLDVLNGIREGSQGQIELFRGLDAGDIGVFNRLPPFSIDVREEGGEIVELPAVNVVVVDSAVTVTERDTGLDVREGLPGRPVETVSTTEIEVTDSLDAFVELTFTEATVSRLNSLGLTSFEAPIQFAIDPATVGTTTTVLEGTANGDVVFRLSITPGEASPGGGSRYYEYSATVPGPIDPVGGQDIQLTELSFVLRDQDGDSREIRLDPLTIQSEARVFGTEGGDRIGGTAEGDIIFGQDGDDILSGDPLLGQNLIVNPEFEIHPDLPETHPNWGFFNEVEGWTADQGKIEIQEDLLPGSPRPRTPGDAVLELDAAANSEVRQTVDLSRLEGYDSATLSLSFDYGGRNTRTYDPPETSTFEVLVDGQVVGTYADMTTSWVTEPGIEIILSADQIASGSLDLAFRGTGVSDGFGAQIDSVSLVITEAGSAGNDILIGGKGDDTLIGGDGNDVFLFAAGDEGTAVTPSVDTIVDFDVRTDVLDLGSLLQGESATAESLDDYLDFTQVNADVHLAIDKDGSGDADVEQTIVFKDTTTEQLAGGMTPDPIDQDIITYLLQNGRLSVDE